MPKLRRILKMINRHDVVIVGAGPGGSAAAHYLARHGLDVLLLDKFDFPRDKTCGDGLTPRALSVLDDMGLLKDLTRAGWRINTASVVAPGGKAVTSPMPKPRAAGWPDYSLILPRLTLDNIILNRALKSGARFRGEVHVTGITRAGNEVIVAGEYHGRSFSARARLVIVATGANVRLPLQMGLLKRPPAAALAARAYYENLSALSDGFHFRFDGVPLPGYGWVFPTSTSTANLGVVLWPNRSRQPNPRAALEAFAENPNLQPMIAGARRVSPIKGYPIRSDFATAPTFGERVLLVGEAAGLVNPLTGEGIDYALESGRIAGEHLISMFDGGDLSRTQLESYDRLLRRRFQRLFVFCNRMRKLFFNRPLLNRLVSAAESRADLKLLLTSIVLQSQEVSLDVLLRAMLKASLAMVRAA